MNATIMVCIHICKERFFVITEFVHMNEKTGTGVNYMKEKVKES